MAPRLSLRSPAGCFSTAAAAVAVFETYTPNPTGESGRRCGLGHVKAGGWRSRPKLFQKCRAASSRWRVFHTVLT